MRTQPLGGPVLGLVLGLVLGMAAGCTPATSSASDTRSRSAAAGPSRAVRVAPVAVEDDDPYLGLARTLHEEGVSVWFEADLVKAWLAGPAALATAVDRLGGLAREVPVRGFKVADELGYQDGISSPEQARACLRAIRTALRQVAPHAEVLVDMVVPPLGCLPWRGPQEEACAEDQRGAYPAATEAAVSSYLQAGLVDRLDLSTGLRDAATYRSWGTTAEQAQQEAWEHARTSWAGLTVLQARKALAAAGGYGGDASTARADLTTYVDIPVAGGAGAVDIWTWRQGYDGSTVSLLAPDLAPNPLWIGLEARHALGVHLFTHMTPSLLPTDAAARDHECRIAARVFGAVFVAAGTG